MDERAFPTPRYERGDMYSLGMTLRDYFAARAMQSTFYPAILESIRIDKDLDCDMVAGFAYTMADAMLKARDK